ncbi:molybdenum cofactor biosynthesis protein MoaE [Brevundimonas subvibrioides]|uniref:Molybdopterin synthase catalytic subunit n=1 Tax=Brevundimonas subvibrioides (strain ATCC 15264 / DSM 4735 / LMG 14903 / NBRC 16000 / CB 81) TaxID=633149 RepID=D9QIC1_BRESC|nr:molybdenum cofactor biosynthesis protein MoaE [Brevundimonas subvibrioides]ADK99423.1 molybdopterin biosynthesis MoaE protein [Brevundimonas subvibrioides ATCC 15264]
MVRLQTDPIDPAALLAAFCRERTDVGAVVSVTGLCRAATDGQAVETLALDAWPGFTERVMGELETETRARFDLIDVVAVHRWGEVRVGEAIVFVAAAAVHRRDAFLAADFLMDQLKTRAPLWKREDGPDGRRWIEPRVSDHADAARWETRP